MNDCLWLGPPPPSRLHAALMQAKLQPRTDKGEPAPEGARLRVIASKGTAPPRPPDRLPWIWVCHGRVDDSAAREAVCRGAYDVLSLLDKDCAAQLCERVHELLAEEKQRAAPPQAVLNSAVSRDVLTQIGRVARTGQPVLITGETGTGKEVTARLIHQWSSRAARPFVPINCAAIPNELMEGQLFGYAKGAFSGALKAYDGQMMAAEGGTVFLDEVDDTPMPLQVKLLRVLEDRVVSRLGENEWHQVNFRIVAATNRDLRELIGKGTFGSDLFERLAIVSITLPPLRERLDDLPTLARHFLKRYYEQEPEARTRTMVTEVSDRALRAMLRYPWPGNIRELRNVIFEALVYKRAGDELLLSDLPRRILVRPEKPEAAQGVPVADVRRRLAEGHFNLKADIEALERVAVTEALAQAGGNVAHAARLLGEVGRGSAKDPGGTLRSMMRRLQIRAE